SFDVKPDPRVRTPPGVMEQVYTLSSAMYYEAGDARQVERQVGAVADQIAKIKPRATGAVADALNVAEQKLRAVEGVSTGLTRVMTLLQGADVQPTAVQLDAIARARRAASEAMAAWTAIRTTELPALNAKLSAAGLPAIRP